MSRPAREPCGRWRRWLSAILEIAYLLIAGRDLRFHDPGPGYYDRLDPQRQTRNKVRELERLNPGMKVTLTAD